MSSIYDDPPSNPRPYPEQKPFGAAESIPTAQPFTPPGIAPIEPPPKKSGCGCVSCLLGCLGITVVLAVLVGLAGWYVYEKWPDMAREGIKQTLEKSDLGADDKKMVLQQVDRLVDGYKQGKVDFQKLGEFVEDFTKSPLMDLLIAFSAKVKYIDNSGLSAEEKAEAEKTLQRVARGVIEEKITREQLDAALDHISTKDPNGQRQFKDQVNDEELRVFLAECKKLADDAMVSNDEFKVDIGNELKKLVDKALGELPAEEPPAVVAPDASAPPDVPAPPEAPAKPDATKPE